LFLVKKKEQEEVKNSDFFEKRKRSLNEFIISKS